MLSLYNHSLLHRGMPKEALETWAQEPVSKSWNAAQPKSFGRNPQQCLMYRPQRHMEVCTKFCSHRIEHGRLCCYSLMRQTDSIVPCSLSKSMNLHSHASLQWFPEQHCSSVLPLQGCVSIVGVYAPALAPVFLVLQALLLGDGAISAQAITWYFPSTLA